MEKTERKRSKRALRESEARFRALFTERRQAEDALREANRELHQEIEQRRRAEESLKERVRMSTLNAEVAVTLNAGTELRAMLQQCAELVVQYLDVAFARVWILNEATQTLELQASAGCYTNRMDHTAACPSGNTKSAWWPRKKRRY